MKRGSWILKAVLLGIIAIGVLGLVTQLLWNWLVPALFGAPMITIWQALGLLLLTKILLWPIGKRHYKGQSGVYWKQKWNGMTDEEKAVFRKKMKEKCGWGSPFQQSKPTDQGERPEITIK
ncbi:MAG: hypothetical protein WAU36_10725 [Cyclobacteriaceae bacterium]